MMKTNLTIAIDIDGIIAEHLKPIISLLNYDHGLNLKRDDITEWHKNIEDIDSDIEKEINKAFNDEDILLNLPLIDGANFFIQAMKEKGFTLFGVTSRRPETLKATKRWLTHHGIVLDGLLMMANQQKPSLNVAILIDDNPEVINTIADENKRYGIMLKQPWNQHIIQKVSHKPNIYIATSWGDIFNNVLNISEDHRSQKKLDPE